MNTSPEEESPKANFASLFRTIVKETFTLENVNYDKSTEDSKSMSVGPVNRNIHISEKYSHDWPLK